MATDAGPGATLATATQALEDLLAAGASRRLLADDWLDGIARAFTRMAGADIGAVLLVDDQGELRVRAVHGFEPTADVLRLDLRRVGEQLRDALDRARPVFIPATGERSRLLGVGDMANFLAVPAGDAPIGLLVAGWRAAVRPPDAQTLALLRVGGAQVRTLVDLRRARQALERAEQATARARTLYAVLSQVNRAIVRAGTEDALLGEVCRAAADYPGIGVAWVGWLDEASGVLRPDIWRGREGAFARHLRIRADPGSPLGQGPAARALREHAIQVVDDLRRGGIRRRNQRKALALGLSSYAFAPVRAGGRRGLVGLHAYTAGFFREEDHSLIADLAENLQFGLSHLRALGEQRHGEVALRTVFDTVPDGLILTDEAGRVELANPAAAAMVGRDLEELVGQGVDMLWVVPGVAPSAQRPAEAAQGLRAMAGRRTEAVGRRNDGGVLPVELRVREARTPWGVHFAVALRDVTAERQAAFDREHAATHDPLTGLVNRAGMAERLDRLAERTQMPGGSRMALAVIDIDGFQQVNEALGSDTGDRVLAAFGRRLCEAAGPYGFVARTGGDEFALVAPFVLARTPQEWARGLARTLERGLRAARRVHRLRVSVGIAVLPDHGSEHDLLLARAALALQQAKHGGGGRVEVFTPALEHQANLARALPERIEQAMARGELSLYYQPQVNMATGEVRSFEALLRWHSPDRGLVMPGQFLPLLSDRRTVVRLGDWVIRSALAQWQAWRDEGIEARVSVNVAPEHFLDPGFARRLRGHLRQAEALGQGALEVEITESTAIGDVARASLVMQEVRALGVLVALDDFGTGYASIAYLADLPFDTIKIDFSFIRRMLDTDDGWSLVHAILFMGLSSEREVVAEGVETEIVEEGLLRLGTRYGQGYLFGRPMPADQVGAWQRRWRVHTTPGVVPPRPAIPYGHEADYVTAIQLHVRWVGRFLTLLRHADHAGATDITDDGQCAFLRWTRRYGEGRAEVQCLAALHLEAHAYARRLLARRLGEPADRLGAEFLAHSRLFLSEAMHLFFPDAPGVGEPARRGRAPS